MINPKRHIFFAVIVSLLLFVVGNLAVPVGASNMKTDAFSITNTPTPQLDSKNMIDSTVPKEVKNVIKSYFDLRYRAFSTLQLDGFGSLISNTPKSKVFLNAELGKLAIEIKHAKLNHLRYIDYEYFLDFNSLDVDTSSQVIIVSVTEGYDVIYESIDGSAPVKPVVSQMRNREHVFVLHKEQNQWKIISDTYNDYLWRMLRKTNISTDELFRTLTAAPRPEQRSANRTKYHCPSLPDDDSTHDYERENAVLYAQEHAYNYNPNYPDYNGEDWGDCTNFVSQSIFEGGNASMAYCEPNVDPFCPDDGRSTSGWYHTNLTHRASAWADVGAFYDFVTHPGSWDEGPEGCDVTINDIDVGDIIQYEAADDENDEIWDHAVIVVGFRDTDGMPMVASHSEDHDYEPYSYYTYDDVRFIHVERIDMSTPRGFDSNGILASYYNDEDDGQWELDGPITWDTFTTPVAHSRLEPFIAFNTGINTPAPGVNGTFWSAIWEGDLQIPQDGNYTFRFKNLDDGARLFVDNMSTPVLESWLVQGFHNYPSESISLSSGLHDFRVEFAQGPGNDCGLIVEWDLEHVFREKIGPYSGEISLPTPTETPTPTPTSTSTPTSTPTPTPTPTITPNYTTSPEPTSTPIWNEAEVVLMKDEPAEKNEAFSALLSQFRDQVLASSLKGDACIDAAYQHALEIMQLFMKDETIRQEVKTLALEVQPLLESMIDNRPKSALPHLDKLWVEQTIKILTKIEKQASPELGEEIRWWKERLPGFVGKTGTEIWEILPDRSQ